MQLFPRSSTTSHQHYCLIIIKTYLSKFSLLVVGATYCLRLALWSGQVLQLLSVCQYLSQNTKCSIVTFDKIFICNSKGNKSYSLGIHALPSPIAKHSCRVHAKKVSSAFGIGMSVRFAHYQCCHMTKRR